MKNPKDLFPLGISKCPLTFLFLFHSSVGIVKMQSVSALLADALEKVSIYEKKT